MINHRLVRGLDYYTGTVFEWVTDQLGSQNAVCAGGRYDGLVHSLGGQEVPGAGFAIGLERLIEMVKMGKLRTEPVATGVYLCMMGDEAERMGFSVAQTLREAGVSTIMHCGGGKLARQLRNADRLNTAVAIIIGRSEWESGNVVVKNLRSDEEQKVIRLSETVQIVKQMLGERN